MTRTAWVSAAGVAAAAAVTKYWFWLRRPTPTPPGTVAAPIAWAGADNIPVIGIVTRLASVITDPLGLVIRNRARYGDVFTLRVPSIYDFTFLLGDEHYRRVLALPTDHAGVGEVLHRVPTVGYWFPREKSGPESLQRLILAGRRGMAEMLPAARVDAVPELAAEVVRRRTANWADSVDLTEVLHPIVYEVCGRYFAGDEFWDALGPRLTRYYRHIGDGIDIPRTTLSITPYHYVMPEFRSTRGLFRMLRNELPGFSAEGSPLLQTVSAMNVDDAPLSEKDRRWMVMYVLWNAMVYPGTYTYWALVDILTRPELCARIQSLSNREQRRELIRNCFTESVRMHPVSSLIRYLEKPYEFESDGRTYHIPAGQAVGVFPGTLNRDRHRIPGDPDSYDPDRYTRPPKPQPATFGRGPFGCIAQHFSETVATSVIDELLQRFELRVTGRLPVRRERIHQTYPNGPLRTLVTAR
ncbi:cytochrome P450 [Nocardia carnea]|uniref:cytochrome P450 n=1 Tax=Nocardia carnea TaxID=37328 RepID=UPI0024540BFA|nr:cytochrome P450 [Nocardia carnea]